MLDVHIAVKNTLTWLAVAVVVAGTIVAVGPNSGLLNASPPPGHETSACQTCLTFFAARGPVLPFEIDDDNIRFQLPVVIEGSR